MGNNFSYLIDNQDLEGYSVKVSVWDRKSYHTLEWYHSEFVNTSWLHSEIQPVGCKRGRIDVGLL